ncbi:unnamed protein product [Adineta ricciae]|uniref:Uncharacterized protein n=1 Tax=Adineta ricciae TaxID=249248 RepID=A0A816CNQ1_ADIRI|nr:unnamed protein product [Adineta ricciae]
MRVEAKRAHHSVLIDVAGESDDLELHGVSLHLTADVKLRKTIFNAHSHPVLRPSLLDIPGYYGTVPVISCKLRAGNGQEPAGIGENCAGIEKTCTGSDSDFKESSRRNDRPGMLKLQAEAIYVRMTNYETLPWSGTVNCQQYVRQLVESLGLKIPDGIQLVGDTLPVIIDLGTMLIQKKATKADEKRKAIY